MPIVVIIMKQNSATYHYAQTIITSAIKAEKNLFLQVSMSEFYQHNSEQLCTNSEEIWHMAWV